MEFFEIANIAEVLFITDQYKNYLWAYLLIGALGFGIVYAFQSAALYTIAVRGGEKNKWMAFVPVLNTYYIGVLSEKNKIFGRGNPKYASLAMAVLEAVYIVLGILYYVATFKIFGGGYAAPYYTQIVSMGSAIDVLDGYNKVNLPANLEWAWWMSMNMPTALIYWVDLAYQLIGVFVLVSFFRTYSSPRYFIFVIFSILFPIRGIFMFAVRNNKAKNYGDYLREQQQRQYRMYQEYMRNGQNGGYGGYNGNGYNGYGGGYNNGSNGQQSANPYDQGNRNTPPDDPFGGLGGQSGNGGASGGAGNNGQNGASGGSAGSDDPFGDL